MSTAKTPAPLYAVFSGPNGDGSFVVKSAVEAAVYVRLGKIVQVYEYDVKAKKYVAVGRLQVK